MVIETPPMGRKEPHDILKSDVRQLSSADQILGAELTWLHMRPLYDQRSVDKRAESPTLVKGLAETLKNLDINSPESEGKAVTDAVPTTGESASALPSTLKKRGSVNYSSSKPLRVLKMNPSESQTLSEYADHYGAPMEALQIGTIPDVKEEGKGLNMEVDQYKVPGKQNVPAPMQRRGTVGKVGFAQVPNAVRLKSPETYYAGVSPAVAVRGTAGQVAQHGTTMFDSGKGSEEPDYVELDEPTHHPNLMDMYLGEVQRTGPPGKCCSGARGNPVHIADEILCNGLYPQRLGPGYPNGHNALTPATSNSSLRSRNLSRTDSVSSGPYSDNGSLGNLAWNRGPNGSAFGGSNNMLTPANSGHFNNTNMQASPGSYGSYPYGGGYGTPGTPASPGTTGSIGSGDGRSPGLHRASVYLPQQEVPNNGMFGDMNYNGSIPESSLDLTNEDCFLCKEKLKNTPIISTSGSHWHENCFVCVQCFQPFPESIFYEHEDRPYCHNCYTVNFAPMCYTCGGWVIGRVIEALDVKWHPECFGCYMCGAELCENGFFKHNGRPICIGCHNLLKKKKKHICNKCFTPIEDYVLWYLVEPYHPYHFSCQNCFKPLDNKYRDKDGTFYCQLCWDTKIQDVCAACKHTIEGRAIKAATKAWHPEHFVCSHCERPLSGDKFMLNEGKPYCQFHYMKMFGVRCFYCDNRSSMQVIKVLNKNYCEDHFFCAGCDTLLEEKKSKVIEMDMKPYCRHCYDKFPSDMRRKLLETAATMNRSQKKGSTKKDKKGSMKKKKEKKGTEEPTKNGNIDNAVDTAA